MLEITYICQIYLIQLPHYRMLPAQQALQFASLYLLIALSRPTANVSCLHRL